MLTVSISAGVAGLTTALLLSKNPKYRITVAAKYMPGDYNAAEYASPWAGANYLPSVIVLYPAYPCWNDSCIRFLFARPTYVPRDSTLL